MMDREFSSAKNKTNQNFLKRNQTFLKRKFWLVSTHIVGSFSFFNIMSSDDDGFAIEGHFFETIPNDLT